MKNYNVGFIGAGNIATAIINGITSSGYIKTESLYVFDTSSDKLQSFKDKGFVVCSSAEELVQNCDFVFLTVKPQVYETVLNQIKNCAENTCFVDVAAGISIDFVKKTLGFDAPVIRVMPNTPLLYGFGATALVHASPVTDAQFSFVKGCFDSCGITVVVDEEHINTITAISGSAPAYIMRTAKNFIDFAENNGMSRSDAESLVLQTLIGSANMILKSDNSIDELIKNVTSPNGTTEAGLKSLNNDEFDKTVENCLNATVNRAKELSQ